MEVAPTPERVAKGGLSLQPVLNTQGLQDRRVYRSKGPVEQYTETWPPDVYNSFLRYVQDYKAKDGPPLTIDYNRSGGGGKRLGGLGNVHQAVRDAYARIEWIDDRLTPSSRQILKWLVLEVRSEVSGQHLGLSDVGTRIFPSIRDRATAKGIAIGRLLGAGSELAMLYRKHDVISGDQKRERERVMKDLGDYDR